jgi:uncharacterized protein DUF2844
MKGSTLSHLLKSLSFIAILFSFHFALAGLGEDEASVQQDHAYFKGRSLVVTDKGTYKVHNITRSDGSVIHEFSGNGKVFAVAWSGGKTHPYLRRILAQNYDAYVAAEAQMPPARARGKPYRIVKTSTLTVITKGHMGNVSGSAVSSGLIPTNMSAKDFFSSPEFK